MRKLAPVLAMLVTLAVAYGLDRLLESARNMAQARVSVAAFQWLIVLANLAFAACVLALAWLMLARPGGRWPAAMSLVVGLALVLLPTPPFWGLGQGVPGGVFPVLQASPYSFFGKASAFLAVVGLAGLVGPLAWSQAGGGPRQAPPETPVEAAREASPGLSPGSRDA